MALPLINISRKQVYLYAIFLVMYEFLTYIANDMIMPGMLKVVASFHAPVSDVAKSLSAYVLGGASLQLFLGPISDRYGRRPVMLFGVAFFLICTIFIACSNSITHFLVARYFQGMGLCFICVIGYATVQEIFTEMDAVRLIAIMANSAVIAPLLGPLLGAIFINYYNWRIIFVLIAIIALLAYWGLWRFMPETIGQRRRDGQLIKAVSLSPRTIASNYKKLALNLPFVLGAVAIGLMTAPCIAWIGLAPVIIVTEAKLSFIAYGLWQLPVFGAYVIGNLLLQRLTHRGSLVKLINLGSWIACLGLAISFMLPLILGHSFLWLMPGLICYFFGIGILGAPLQRYVLFLTPVSKGTATGFMSTLLMFINGAGVELANIIYSTHQNRLFGLFCMITGIVYLIVLAGVLLNTKSTDMPEECA